MYRFDMAEALLRRAKLMKLKIGDDHGDPYEEVLLTRKIGLDFKIDVKEIFDHLRSALDYCAHGICEVSNCGQDISSYKVYFPIAKRGLSKADFKSIIGRNIHGLVQNRIDLLPIFESFQPFSANDNQWIADFATLCNENKHEQLSVVECSNANIEFKKGDKGQTMISILKKDGNPILKSPLMIIDNYPKDGIGKCTGRYISFDAINEEFLNFLDNCIIGVENIINKLKNNI